MQLNTEQLRDVYEAMVKPVGHPDPLGFMARAILTSEGDPDYIDINGTQGFIPLDPDRAIEQIGVLEVQSLEGNIGAALALDIEHIERFGNSTDMIVATHDGLERVGNPTPETKEMLEALPEAREEMRELLFPPLATVEDVIAVLQASDDVKPNKTRMKFFEGLLNGRT